MERQIAKGKSYFMFGMENEKTRVKIFCWCFQCERAFKGWLTLGGFIGNLRCNTKGCKSTSADLITWDEYLKMAGVDVKLSESDPVIGGFYPCFP